MSVQAQGLFWFGVTALFLLFVHVFSAVLLPFVLGIAVAYLLNPIVNSLSAHGFSRLVSTLFILGGFCVFVLAGVLALLPIVYHELVRLSADLPGYIDQAWVYLEPLSQNLMGMLRQENGVELKELLQDHAGSAVNVAKSIWGGVAASSQAFAQFASVLIIMPIVAFFMMQEWPAMTKWGQDLMPRDHEKTIMNLLKEIDKKLSGFVRGQITVAFVLGVAYAIALSIAGLDYGVLIGLGAGILGVIPMVGSTVGLLVGIAVAWFQSGEWQFVMLIGGIFIIGQIIEGNFLTPKFVGESVGLHPLWVFFALVAGGSLFGILGMLLAVPVAAVASVLIAFGILKYKASALYKGKKASKPKAKGKRAGTK